VLRLTERGALYNDSARRSISGTWRPRHDLPAVSEFPGRTSAHKTDTNSHPRQRVAPWRLVATHNERRREHFLRQRQRLRADENLRKTAAANRTSDRHSALPNTLRYIAVFPVLRLQDEVGSTSARPAFVERSSSIHQAYIKHTSSWLDVCLSKQLDKCLS